MANAKQRARRAKEKRHGIEIVEIDEEGNERVVDSSALKAAKPPDRVKGKGAGGAQAKQRGRREPQPASWQRALKRAGIFGPIFLLFFLVVKPEKTGTAAVIIQALLMIVIFVPLTYYVDKAAYRSYHKRLAKGDAGRDPRKR